MVPQGPSPLDENRLRISAHSGLTEGPEKGLLAG